MPEGNAPTHPKHAQAFEYHRKPPMVKLRAAKTWLGGASLRKTCRILEDECTFSHEAVRQWGHRYAHLFRISRTRRKTLVIDETSLFLEDGTEVFGWACVDADTFDIVLSWVSQGRSGFEAWLFLKNVLDRCKDPPRIVVDRGPWYPWALDALDLEWEVVSGGCRNLVESYFSSLKWRIGRMCPRPGTWHTRESLQDLLDAYAWWWNLTT